MSHGEHLHPRHSKPLKVSIAESADGLSILYMHASIIATGHEVQVRPCFESAGVRDFPKIRGTFWGGLYNKD